MFPNPLLAPFTVWTGFQRGSESTWKKADHIQVLHSYAYVDSLSSSSLTPPSTLNI